LSLPRVIFLGGVFLFASIGIAFGVKKFLRPSGVVPVVAQEESLSVKSPKKAVVVVPEGPTTPPVAQAGDFPNISRIHQLFATGGSKLPIVETVTYTSQVPWLKGRPAWVADYAAYYSTSRHFIARSLNGKPDYLSQRVASGSKFNVFAKAKKIQFYLVADLSLCKMGFYYVDLDTNERVFLKAYSIGVGKLATTESGCLTPIGRYVLGDKIAIYKPGVKGTFQDRSIEMIRVFGTRWIPFEIDQSSSAPSKGYGLHGAPWDIDRASGDWVEKRDCIGKYESDGCIRLTVEDMEELFSIVITKPTVVEVVKHFSEAVLPGVEVAP
jgi:hypothetical protein